VPLARADGLLSLPFFAFTLPMLFEALTNARPTGYDATGACVRMLTARERAKKLRSDNNQRARASVARLGARYGGGADGGARELV
jgi:hypothetical protein